MRSDQNTISFVLDDEIVEINFAAQQLSSTLTVLNYLRSTRHIGVKEGCAEGDCGACTVVIAGLDKDEKLVYKAINSCLVFLPMIHGKQLITVENLAIKNGNELKLHPVQQALVDMNGSQCGYCTPGIIMSMFALYKNHQNHSREIIKDALTGNLCRCTGYQSIIKATQKACKNRVIDHFSEKEPATCELLKTIASSSDSVSIITNDQKYFQPQNLNESFVLLEEYPDAVCVNGSTDIALGQTKKFNFINEIIDLSAIEELKQFKEMENDFILGSGLSLEDLKSELRGSLPAFSKMLNIFASKQIRNLASLGGNIATASPIGDTLPLLMAYNANIRLIGKTSNRILPIEKFLKGYRLTALQEGEIIHSVIIPRLHGQIIRFYKVSKRKDLDISTVSAGFRINLLQGKVEDICLAYGGMADMVKRAKLTEGYLIHKEWNEKNLQQAQMILENEFNPISDARSGSEFRKIAAKNLLIKFFEETK